MKENVKIKSLEIITVNKKVIGFFQKPSFLKGVRQGFLFSSVFLVIFQIVKPTALALCVKEDLFDSSLNQNSCNSKKREYLKTWVSIKSWRSYFQSGFKPTSEYENFSSTIKNNISPFLTGGLLGIVLGSSIGYMYDKLYLSKIDKLNVLK